MEQVVLDWLLQSEHFVEYNSRIEFLKTKNMNEQIIEIKSKIIADQRVTTIIEELLLWPGAALKRHNDAKHSIHKLSFLADIGLRKEDAKIGKVIERILKTQSSEGSFEIIMNIPTHFGGSGEDDSTWMLCDAPTVLYSLMKLGLDRTDKLERAYDHLISLKKENGWHCTVSEKLGKFRGPGRKGDPCPYANLITLKALIQHPKWKKDKIAYEGAEVLLSLWTQRKERKPYLFGMGTDFKKLKAPMIWYDIIHLTDVLSQLSNLHKDERFLEMISIIKRKADTNGFFSAESVWRAAKGWDFGQKKEPSPWITFLVYRILNRLE